LLGIPVLLVMVLAARALRLECQTTSLTPSEPTEVFRQPSTGIHYERREV
jgi:hypothetical protein